MDKHFPSLLERISDESIRKPEKFFSVLLGCIPEINCEVFEIILSFCILFASDIQDMGNSKVKQMLRF